MHRAQIVPQHACSAREAAGSACASPTARPRWPWRLRARAQAGHEHGPRLWRQQLQSRLQREHGCLDCARESLLSPGSRCWLCDGIAVQPTPAPFSPLRPMMLAPMRTVLAPVHLAHVWVDDDRPSRVWFPSLDDGVRGEQAGGLQGQVSAPWWCFCSSPHCSSRIIQPKRHCALSCTHAHYTHARSQGRRCQGRQRGSRQEQLSSLYGMSMTLPTEA